MAAGPVGCSAGGAGSACVSEAKPGVGAAAGIGQALAHFLGQWTDSQGHDVGTLGRRPVRELAAADGAATRVATAVEPYQAGLERNSGNQLKVELRKAGRKTIQLDIRPKNGTFICGHYEMCQKRSDYNTIHWMNKKYTPQKPAIHSVWNRGGDAARRPLMRRQPPPPPSPLAMPPALAGCFPAASSTAPALSSPVGAGYAPSASSTTPTRSSPPGAGYLPSTFSATPVPSSPVGVVPHQRPVGTGCASSASSTALAHGSPVGSGGPVGATPAAGGGAAGGPASGRSRGQVVRTGETTTVGTCEGRGHDMHRLEQISRKLSQVLRHGDRVAVREDGFSDVQEVLRLRRLQELRCTLEDLQLVVDGSPESGNRKERFQLIFDEMGGPMIRAVQGFSRKDVIADRAYRRLTGADKSLPEACVHGTYRQHWVSICKLGLLPGGLGGRQKRSEVHFACAEPDKDAAVSGMRSDCNLVIWVDLRRALEDGLPFYLSENGVILSPGDAGGCIPTRYFLRVVDYTVDPPTMLWESGSAMQ
uniref:2'-phosphotransferase n=1 Tax=Alexandrium monilatum TaxID=311494 RepID=A0A7S4RFP3_9DINO